jgi:hypothetical protein
MEQDFVIFPGGVHVWEPAKPDLSGIPDDVVEERSKRYTLNLLETPGWKKIDSEKIIAVGDVPEPALKLLTATGEEFIEMLNREIGDRAQLYQARRPPHHQYQVRLFDKRTDFCRYANICGASQALSLYNPVSREMGLHFGDDVDHEEFEHTYAHEFTHAFMDHVYRVTEPLWFAEGMAEYFSRLEWTKRGYKPTGRNWKAMMHMGEELIPLPKVLAATREDMYGLNFPLYYAEAWALVRFLLKNHPELVDVLLNKGKPNLEYLSNDFMAYMKRLRRG